MTSLRIKNENENKIHFITITTIAWTDIFTSKKYFEILLDSLIYCQKNKNLLVYEYVFMTNHIHLILQVKEGGTLSQVVNDFKKHTTREILKLLKEDNRKYLLWILEHSFQNKENSQMQLWQSNNYPEVIEEEKFYMEKQNYICNNPVKKGFVKNPENWQYSSAGFRIHETKERIDLANI